ncbi:AfsR/SARP family transcriptional regulator [Actinophytocola sp.]|uniref:AfsR/SARP family transcriptional regulator n=1 Tax=Actinophytocola sp. TaxID=1872138 RepID=UPI002D7FF500|nr:BTAD domain-containing putative transcriptional regulator [Actinophytocola sp.]HET9143338.1 BTAD domain-containing putative transcriptional regulator [Actinophytocola sp.]
MSTKDDRSAGPDVPAGSIELNLLGGFRLLVDGELVRVSLTGQRVMAVVACQSGPAIRSQVAHLLWPDTTNARAHANLRTAVYRLDRSCPGMVEATSSYLRLATGIRVDVEASMDLARRVLGTGDALDATLTDDALHVNLHDDLLPDWDDEWLGDHQRSYRQFRLTALETLSQRLVAAGQHGAAVQTALAAVQADGLRDSAYETLIRACLAQGNRHEALSHFAAYQRVIRDELGLEPAPSIGQLLRSA